MAEARVERQVGARTAALNERGMLRTKRMLLSGSHKNLHVIEITSRTCSLLVKVPAALWQAVARAGRPFLGPVYSV